ERGRIAQHLLGGDGGNWFDAAAQVEEAHAAVVLADGLINHAVRQIVSQGTQAVVAFAGATLGGLGFRVAGSEQQPRGGNEREPNLYGQQARQNVCATPEQRSGTPRLAADGQGRQHDQCERHFTLAQPEGGPGQQSQ